MDQSIDIECSINYEFYNYEDLESYQPMINFTFYYQQNNSNYQILDKIYLNDNQINENKSYLWQRLIRYRIPSIDKHETHRKYLCIIASDSTENRQICQTNIYIPSRHFSI